MPDSDDSDPDGGAPSVSPRELYERIQRGEGVTLVDLRNRDEFEAWRIDGPGVDARQIPYAQFVQAQVTGDVTDPLGGVTEPVVAVCARGEASDEVAALLRAEGVEAANLAEGMEGWARVYVARELQRGVEAPLAVIQYDRPSSGCLSYLVHDGSVAAVVDPLRAFAERYVADADDRGLELRYAIDTHVHADHVSGVRDVAGLDPGVEMVLPAGARERGLDPEAFVAAVPADGASGDADDPTDRLRLLEDGAELSLGEATLTALATPGHTSESLSYRVGDVVLCGDTLFLESVARPDLEDGEEGVAAAARQLYETLHERLLALPASTVVAPGHYGPAADPADDGTYTARLGDLGDGLPLLGLAESAFLERIQADMPPRPSNYERIITTNIGRTQLDDDDAFELELGPNNCAATAEAD